jgi:HEAT repeat protein/PBS lyase HEAT-like repeat-containing protein
VLASLKDSDPAIRAAAAGSLGAMQKPRGVEALLDTFPREKSPVAEAVLQALGATKSDRAYPLLTNALEAGDLAMQRAAVKALVNFGGSNAIAALTQRIDTHHLALRYAIVKALADSLHQPLRLDWLWPVLMGRERDQEWIDSLYLLRSHTGDQAVPALLSCLDFDAPWSGRNWWIFNQVRTCTGAPRIDYDYDPNSDGTPEQWEKNLRTLKALKPLAGPIPLLADGPKAPPVPYLKTDPPIDFTPTIKEAKPGEVEIRSGFLTLTLRRQGATGPYSVSEPYRAVYQKAAAFRALPRNPQRCAALKITPEQMARLIDLLHKFAVKLCGPLVSDQETGYCYNDLISFSDICPYVSGNSRNLLAAYKDYKEAPPGPLRDQAKADLIDSVRLLSQNYHAGTVEFVESAKKIFTPEQLEQILRP